MASDGRKTRQLSGAAFTTALEVVSKAQIRSKGKAQADRESAAYMSM